MAKKASVKIYDAGDLLRRMQAFEAEVVEGGLTPQEIKARCSVFAQINATVGDVIAVNRMAGVKVDADDLQLKAFGIVVPGDE